MAEEAADLVADKEEGNKGIRLPFYRMLKTRLDGFSIETSSSDAMNV